MVVEPYAVGTRKGVCLDDDILGLGQFERRMQLLARFHQPVVDDRERREKWSAQGDEPAKTSLISREMGCGEKTATVRAVLRSSSQTVGNV